MIQTGKLGSSADIHRRIEGWLTSEGANFNAAAELAYAVHEVWPHLSQSDAAFFADGMLCGLYLAREDRL